MGNRLLPSQKIQVVSLGIWHFSSMGVRICGWNIVISKSSPNLEAL